MSRGEMANNAGTMCGPSACRIHLEQEDSLVYLDIVWTSSNWCRSPMQISALHQDDSLELFVIPIGSTNIQNECGGLDWDGHAMKKNGEVVPDEDLLELKAAMQRLLEWLKQWTPVVLVTFDRVCLNESLDLLRLLTNFDLYKEFSQLCRGVIPSGKIPLKVKGLKPTDMPPKSLPNPYRLTVENCSLQMLSKHSLSLNCLLRFEEWREAVYQKKISLEQLYKQGIITTSQANRLAEEGLTFKELQSIFHETGMDGLRARLSAVSSNIYKYMSGYFNPDVFSKHDVEKLCDYFGERNSP